MAVHEETLEAARRICRERGSWIFRVPEIVGALPHLNASTVRTHIVSRCCVNAPKNHLHKWDYFRRTGRGEYEICPKYRSDPEKRTARQGLIQEQPAAYVTAEPLRDTIHFVARRSEGFYVGEGMEIAIVSQGRSLDELIKNLREAIRLYLEGENLASLGLVRRPRLVVTFEDSALIDG